MIGWLIFRVRTTDRRDGDLGRRWTWGWSTGDAPEGRCADGGATAFVDSRTAVQGRHSLRLTTPTEFGGVVIVPYEAPVAADKKYLLSVWCRASPGAEPQRVRSTPASRATAAADEGVGRRWRCG